MPIYSPTGFLDITNATLRTSNTECQNLKIGTGNLYVTSEISPSYELNLSNVTSLGATSPHTLTLSNVTTAIDATSNIITSGNLKIGGLVYTKDWGIRAASGGNDLYVGRFTVHGITEVLITDQGASLGSASKFTITRNVSSTPLVNGIDSSSTINYEWYFKSHDSTTYDLWVRPSATVQTNIKVTSSTYIEVDEPTGVTLIPCVNGLINMSGNVVANQNLTVSSNLTVSGNATVSTDLTVSGNTFYTSPVTINVDSNVVAEYTGPHDRPLRKYPEVAMTSASETASGYKGYKVTASNDIDNNNNLDKFRAFNGITGNEAWGSGGSQFTSGTGVAIVGGDSLGNVEGQWLKLQLPLQIKLSHIKLTTRDIAGIEYPKDFQILGSNDDSNWTQLINVVDAPYTQHLTLTHHVTGTVDSFQYLAVVVTKTHGGTGVTISELEYYGHEEGSASLDTTLKSVYNVPATTGTQLEVYYDAKDLTTMPSTVTDLSPNTNDGSLSDSPQISNGAFVFDGVNDYIYNSRTGYTPLDKYTASVWVKFLPDAGSSSDPCIFQFGNGSNHSSFGMISDTSENRIRAFIYGNNAVDIDERVDNVWYHLCATYYASNGRTDFFINGILKKSVTSGTAMTIPSTPYLSIGVQTNSSNAPISTTYFTGSIANFRLYSKALNADQVKELYDYQKDYFLGSKSQVTMYKGHLGVGVTEPSGQLELAGDERIQEYPPRDLGGFETMIEGEGTYKVSSSSDVPNPSVGNPQDHPATAFTANDTFFRGVNSGYAYNTTVPAIYTGTHFTNGVGGDFLQIELPYKIYLKSINITARTLNSLIDRAPHTGFIFGSNDSGTTWSQVTSWSGLNWTVGESKPIQINSNTLYSTYRLVANKLSNSSGNASRFNIDRWQLFGTPGPTTLDKGSLSLTRSLDVPRVSRYDVDTETPRPEKLVLDFDTTVNSSPTDISGKGNHGTFYNGASYSAADKAFNFDGTDDYIQTGTGVISGTNPKFSISLWVNYSGTSSETFCMIGDTYGTNTTVWCDMDTSNGKPRMNFINNDVTFSDPNTGLGVLTPNVWNHLVYVFNGATSGGRSAYVNGVKQVATAESGTFANENLVLPSSSVITIGALDHSTGFIHELIGKISNFKLYNVALEPSEVQKLYRLGRTGRSMVISDTAVGIGKVPEAQLDVRGSARFADVMINGSVGNGKCSLSLTENPTASAGVRLKYDGVDNALHMMDYDDDANIATFMRSGNVGIGSASPGARFQITQGGTGLSNGIRLIGGRTWNIYNDASGHLSIRGPSFNGGYISEDSDVAQITFTGQHRNFIDGIPVANYTDFEGLIVSANKNKYYDIDENVTAGANAIQISQSLPLVALSNVVHDKACFGVISGVEDPETREYAQGSFVSVVQKQVGDRRAYINSVGEGAIWVTNINGPLESGDYITTSNVTGYGMKQESEFLANYTVAKITMDCDFNPETQPIQIIRRDETGENILDEHGQIQWENHPTDTEKAYKIRYLDANGVVTDEANHVHKAAFVGCTYHCG